MYDYKTQKPNLFKEENQELFLKIRDKVKAMLKFAGAVRMGEILHNNTGSSWDMMACVDRMVEIQELRELRQERECAGQERVFVALTLEP